MFGTNDLNYLMQKVEENGWGIALLSHEFCNMLLDQILILEKKNQLQPATITEIRKNQTTADASSSLRPYRNDFTFWIEQGQSDINDQLIIEISRLQQYLKNYFRVSLTHFECHYAKYPINHFYKKHIDQTKDNNQRLFSFVIYLNKDWQNHFGGELVGYHSEGEEILFRIAPNFGHMILFRSDIPHEVLESYQDRRSIAGWFRK